MTVAVAEAPAKIQLTATVSGGVPPYTVTWSFGDGSASATGTTVTHTYTIQGSYGISANVVDSLGATLSGAASLAVVSALASTIQVNHPQSEVGIGNLFTASPSGGQSPYAVVWDFGDGGSGSGASVSHTYQTSGTFTVTATITDSLGYVFTVTLTISVAPALSVSIGT